MVLFFLSSGLFLGWSLGANDAANVFGTAVGTKMVRFRTAAIICSLFLVLGAVVGGAGATHTLGSLGAVNAIAGSFMVALAAAFTVYWMTRLKLPVSTSQAVVGAIIGWNLFSGSLTDVKSITKIVTTWVVCPLLSAFFAIVIYLLYRWITRHISIHMIRQDMFTRVGLLLVGAFGSYSLGANNIANVMGVFVPVSPFSDLNVAGLFTLDSAQQLFLLGGIAISIGVFTYSHKVMETVGGSIFRLSPETALIVVMAESLVLFLFSSTSLEGWLLQHGLPSIPLVPVSSSQAVVGAVIGIGIIKGVHEIKLGVLREITTGWITTPIIAGIISFIALFILQNVFDQHVSHRMTYDLSEAVIAELSDRGVPVDELSDFNGSHYDNGIKLESLLQHETGLNATERRLVVKVSLVKRLKIDPIQFYKLDRNWFSSAQLATVRQLIDREFEHTWQLRHALTMTNASWRSKPPTADNRIFNEALNDKFDYLIQIFSIHHENK